MTIKNRAFLYAISIVISFGSFVFGYALVCISMMSDNIQKAHPLEEQQFHFQLSLITTLLPLGAFLGISSLIYPLCDRWGENKAMIFLDIFGTITIVLQAYQIQFWSLYAGRFLLGIYVGIASGIIPVYLISLSPPQVSGIIGSFNQLLITIGIAAAYGLGQRLQSFRMIDLSWKRYMLIPALFCIIRLTTLLYFKFDRLERHFQRGDTQTIKKYISYFYQRCTVEELREIRSFKDKQLQKIQKIYEDKNFISSLIDKLTGGATKNVIKIALVLALANQFSGINAILFYAKQVFQHITLNNKVLSNQYTFYLGILQVIITFGSGFLINRFGRRSLMLVGETIIVASLLLGFFFEHMIQNSEGYITIVVFTHIIGFSISLGPVSMLYVAQMMENITLVVCAVWIFTLFVSMVSQIMITTYGIGNVFLFYGLISLFCLIYLSLNMVESKGLSRKELVAKLQGNIKYESLGSAEDHEMVQLHQAQQEKEPEKISETE